MSKPDALGERFSAVASELSVLCAEAIEQQRIAEMSNESVGQAFASILRLFAEKSQAGEAVQPFGRNTGVAATDVAIGCIALMKAANLELFELGAWQRLTSVNRGPSRSG